MFILYFNLLLVNWALAEFSPVPGELSVNLTIVRAVIFLLLRSEKLNPIKDKGHCHKSSEKIECLR